MGFLIKGKRALELEILGKLLIGLGVLIIVVLGYFIISGKLVGVLSYLKNIFRFRN